MGYRGLKLYLDRPQVHRLRKDQRLRSKTGGAGLLKKARSTSDLIGTGKRPQREIFEALDKMREEDDR